jgi:hypothetical protein
VVALLVVAATTVVIWADSPATPPSKTYRMVAEPVEGVEPRQWVLVIVTPEQYAWVATPAAVRACVERRISGGSTLEWVPQDVQIGGEPLTEPQEVDALRKACEARNIKFVHVPAG